MDDADQVDGLGILGWRARAIDAEVALDVLNRQLDDAVQTCAALRVERDNLAAITENNNAWIARLHNEAIDAREERGRLMKAMEMLHDLVCEGPGLSFHAGDVLDAEDADTISAFERKAVEAFHASGLSRHRGLWKP